MVGSGGVGFLGSMAGIWAGGSAIAFDNSAIAVVWRSLTGTTGVLIAGVQCVVGWLGRGVRLCFVSGVWLWSIFGICGGVKLLVLFIGDGDIGCGIAKAWSLNAPGLHSGCSPCGVSGVLVEWESLEGCGVVIVVIKVVIGGGFAVIVGVVGEVLAGSLDAIGRSVVRFNLVAGAKVLRMLAFKASKSKRGGGGAILLRFGVGVGNTAAVLVSVDQSDDGQRAHALDTGE